LEVESMLSNHTEINGRNGRVALTPVWMDAGSLR
jgi:hypothetical protein